jgi:hypothetical protein
MSQQRLDYFSDVLADAQKTTSEPEIAAALVLSDAINGLRKAVLDVSENVRALVPAKNNQTLR